MFDLFKKNRLDSAVPLLLFASCCLLFAFSPGCQSTNQPTPEKSTMEGPDQEGWNSTITVTTSRVTALVNTIAWKISKSAGISCNVAVDFTINRVAFFQIDCGSACCMKKPMTWLRWAMWW
jgi:hypothetical protein